jgi:hypothetical protein
MSRAYCILAALTCAGGWAAFRAFGLRASSAVEMMAWLSVGVTIAAVVANVGKWLDASEKTVANLVAGSVPMNILFLGCVLIWLPRIIQLS